MWHVSAQGRWIGDSKWLARQTLAGVGDATLGEWEHAGERPRVWHIQRRLSAVEQELYGVPDPVDVRGDDEDRQRLVVVLQELG